jgi:hypothetical protein
MFFRQSNIQDILILEAVGLVGISLFNVIDCSKYSVDFEIVLQLRDKEKLVPILPVSA